MRNEILIQNGSLEEFLMSLVENLGREEITTASFLSKKIYQAVRFISNFNLPGKARKNVEHHYDIGGDKGEKLYDIFQTQSIDSILALIGKKIQKLWRKHNKTKLIIL